MTDKGHRRLEYALIVAGILVFGALCGLAVDGVSGNWKVGGDLVVSGDISGGDDITANGDLYVIDDTTLSDALSVAGASSFADSVYCADALSVADEKILQANFVALRPWTGAFPDTTGLPNGTLAIRSDTLYMLEAGKAAWQALN